MTDVVTAILTQVLAEYGPNLCSEPMRCQALLQQRCPAHKREVNLLVLVLKTGLITQILTLPANVPLNAAIQSWVAQLDEHVGMAEAHALWAVQTWLVALGITSPSATVAESQSVTPSKIMPALNQTGFVKADTLSSAHTAELARWGYVDNGDATITDTKTGLMWKQQPEERDYRYKEAMQCFNQGGIEFAGFDDWRLPTIIELKSLIIPKQQPAICLLAFPQTKHWFWSSSPQGGNPYHAWRVSFYDGSVYSYLRDYCYGVRLVRSLAPNFAD